MNLPLFLLFFYILVEYGKPKILGPYRLALITQALLVICLILDGGNTRKVFSILKDRYFKLYMCLMALMALHVFIAANNYVAYIGFRTMLTYLIVGVSCCVFIDSIRKLEIFLGYLVFVMALCAINRIAGAGYFGIHGAIGDTNDFALGMNVMLPIGFFLWKAEKGRRKWFFASASVLFMLANVDCASRGGFLGMGAVGTVCWLYSKRKARTLLVIVPLAALAWNFASPSFKDEMKEVGVDSAERDTGKGRIELWKVGWKAFAANPILGVGQANMPILFPEYQYDDEGKSYFKRAEWGRVTHSVYFTLLPELGLVGALIFVLMIRDLIQKYRKIKGWCDRGDYGDKADKIGNMNIGLLISLFGFLVTGIFLSAFYYPEFWNMSMLLVALFLVSSKILGDAQA